MIVEETPPETKEKISNLLKETRLSLLRQGKHVYLTANGMSMYPFLKSCDKLKITPLKNEDVRIGDLVAVDRKDDAGAWFVVHRLVKISKDKEGKARYFTKGDAHKRGMDNPVIMENIAGRVAHIQRKNIDINLESRVWKYANLLIAKMSLLFPRTLIFLSRYMNLIIEWKLFLSKVKNRFKKGDPISYNTDEFILICACNNLNEELKKKAVTLIEEGIDWEGFVTSAMRGGVTVLVYNALKIITTRAHIPQLALDRLKIGYLYIVSKTASQYIETIELLKLFAAEKIPVIPLKGPFLSKMVYKDIAARSVSIDIDLLIEEKNKERAWALLEKSGYFTCPISEVSRRESQHVFSKPNAMMINIHWDITMAVRSKERIEGLWKGVRSAEEGGASYYEFREEELLLYLCSHMVNSDALRHLRYVCDINGLICRYGRNISWDRLIEKAKEWKLSSSLYTALIMSKKLLDCPIPNEIFKKSRPIFTKRIFIGLFTSKKFILRDGMRKRFMDTFLSVVFFEVIEARSLKEYAAIFNRVFFPPKEILKDRSYVSRIFSGLLKFFHP